MNRPTKANFQNPLKEPQGTQLVASSDGALLLFGLFVGVVGLLSGSLGVLPASAQVTYRDYAGDDGGRSGASGGLYGGQLVRPVLRYTEPAGGGFNTPTWSDCDNNNPGLRKNLEQFGRFIPTAIMGNDDRCPLSYAPNAPEIERQFYGVGSFYYDGNDGGCLFPNGKSCESTGHLVMDADMVIASGHGFVDPRTGRRVPKDSILRNFRFAVKEWIPEQLREDQRVAYEYRYYEIEDIEFGDTTDYSSLNSKDYAFIKLKRRVGEVVSRVDADGREIGSDRFRVPPERQVRPLPFRRFDRRSVPNVVMTVGFQADKEGDAQKNCRPFSFHDFTGESPTRFAQNRAALIAHDGDTNGVASGSALTLMVGGRPHYAGLHIGAYPQGGLHQGNFNIANYFNVAIDGQSFYDRFMQFRRRFGRD